MKYGTLIQHSAFTVARKPGFRRAVEVMHVTEPQAREVLKHGGLVFALPDLYPGEYDVNYPPEVGGLYPCCRGTFKRVSLKPDSVRLYIPAEGETLCGQVLALPPAGHANRKRGAK